MTFKKWTGVLLGVAASLVLGSAQAAPAAGPKTVLILGPTVSGAPSWEEQQAIALGFTVEVADATTWAGKSQSDFASYRALILGDPRCSGVAQIAAAEANRTTWSKAVTGNIIIIGTDEVYHLGTGGAGLVTTNGIAFATGQAGKTGLFASLSCYYASASTPTPVPVLDQFGTFNALDPSGCFDNVHIVASHPALTGLTDANLSNWGCSIHETFSTFPAGFTPLAISNGVTGTGSLKFSDGSFGIPYILVTGTGITALGSTTAAIPTLSEWMLIATGLLLAGLALVRLKRS